MTQKIQQENDEYTQHQRILCVLIVLITICSLGIISLLEIQTVSMRLAFGGCVASAKGNAGDSCNAICSDGDACMCSVSNHRGNSCVPARKHR